MAKGKPARAKGGRPGRYICANPDDNPNCSEVTSTNGGLCRSCAVKQGKKRTAKLKAKREALEPAKPPPAPIPGLGPQVDRRHNRGRTLALSLIDSMLEDAGNQQLLQEQLQTLLKDSPGFFFSRILIPLCPKEILMGGIQGEDPIQFIIGEATKGQAVGD